MFNYHVAFESPWYLLLLVLVPILWWMSLRSLAALGRFRRAAAILLRSIVLVLLILAVAEIQMVRTSDRLTVIYLLDQSLSIPAEHRQAMVEYTNAVIREHRKGKDRVGVIVFGRDAAIEVPPYDDDVQMPAVESLLDPEYTNLAGAMKLAQASFPEDAAKRIVILSDGNENLGDAIQQAQGVSGGGVGIDVLPIRYKSRAEVVVEKVTVPSDLRRGEPFDLKVVVTNTAQPTADEAGVVRGRLVLSQMIGDRTVVLNPDEKEQRIELPPGEPDKPGKRVFSFRQQIDTPDFYTYQARFIPDRPQDDAMPQNNRATTFTHIRGKGQVLLIEDYENLGQFDRMIEALKRQNLEVNVQRSDQLFANLAELQPYDTVILANVPREDFTEAQIQMLVRNTQQMGAGLVMLGGPNSFGAGGWTSTEVEKAMPVDFQIKSAKVVPRGALAMIMHACEIPQGNHWQKVVAREALKSLGGRDYCGVVHWNGQDQWLWRPGLAVVGERRKSMLGRLDRMTPGDMPQFDPAMLMARREFAKLDADPLTRPAIKHMIIISDGDPSKPRSATIGALKDLKVTVSTVAVGARGHAPGGAQLLRRIAERTGGKFYNPRSPKALPRIFQKEARRVARPLIYEKKVQPQVKFPHEMISGIEGPLPTIGGFVMTTIKENPLVEVALVSPKPLEVRNSTILASWSYGLGRAVAFTTDAGARWASQWASWENYDRLFGQIIRWSMRPTGDAGKFTVATDFKDGRVSVVVTALDKDDEFLNFLDMNGTVVGPNLDPVELKLEQTAPGRYVGDFAAADAGSYFVLLSPGAGMAPIRTGVNVPYSDEFRDRVTNEPLLGQLAGLVPKGGSGPGTLIEIPQDFATVEPELAVNTFRHDLPKATSRRDAWYYLVLVGSCLFFFDVFIRRVQVSFAWVPVLAGQLRAWVLRREPPPREPEYIERLQGRKAQVSDRLEQLRTSARFEMPVGATPDAKLPQQAPTAPTSTPPQPTMTTAEQAEEESYTQRLLRAKREVWKAKEKQAKDEGQATDDE